MNKFLAAKGIQFIMVILLGETLILHPISIRESQGSALPVMMTASQNIDQPGSISGHVFNSNENVISYHLRVEASGMSPDTGQARVDVTQSDGSYTISGLAPGMYKLFANTQFAPGFASEYYRNKSVSADAEPIVVRSGENVTGIDFALKTSTPVTGRLVDSFTHNPIGGGFSDTISALDQNFHSISIAMINSDGTFQIDRLAPGSYYFMMLVDGYGKIFFDGTNNRSEATLVTVNSQGIPYSLGQQINIPPEITLSGHIYNQDGITPISHTWVRCRAANGLEGIPIAITNSSGEFTLHNLVIGDYLLQFSADGYETSYFQNASSWETATPLHITSSSPPLNVHLTHGGSISGYVFKSDGTVITDELITIQAIGISPGTLPISSYVSQADGSYEIGGLRNGTYVIQANSENAIAYGTRYSDAAYASRYYDDQITQADAASIVISSSSDHQSGINFFLDETSYDFAVADTAISLDYVDPDVPGIQTYIDIPIGAVDEPTLITYSPFDETSSPVMFDFVGLGYSLNAYQNGQHIENFTFNQEVHVEIHYTDEQVIGLDESQLFIKYYNKETSRWEEAACGAYERHPQENWLAVPTCHCGHLGLYWKWYSAYLPSINK